MKRYVIVLRLENRLDMYPTDTILRPNATATNCLTSDITKAYTNPHKKNQYDRVERIQKRLAKLGVAGKPEYLIGQIAAVKGRTVAVSLEKYDNLMKYDGEIYPRTLEMEEKVAREIQARPSFDLNPF